MNKKIIAVCFMLVLLAVVFAGCLNSEESKFIGSWKASDSMGGVFEFKDGILSKPVEITSWGLTVEGSWRVENGVLYIEYTLDGQKIISKYTYEFQGSNSVKMTVYGSSFVQTWTKM